MGNTPKNTFELNNVFTIYVPDSSYFRVYAAGWDADGVDYFMGDIFNPYSSCNSRNKLYLKSKLFNINHMILSGCMDDKLGEISTIHSPASLVQSNFFSSSPKDGMNDDPCPFSKFLLKNRYTLYYSIEMH